MKKTLVRYALDLSVEQHDGRESFHSARSSLRLEPWIGYLKMEDMPANEMARLILSQAKSQFIEAVKNRPASVHGHYARLSSAGIDFWIINEEDVIKIADYRYNTAHVLSKTAPGHEDAWQEVNLIESRNLPDIFLEAAMAQVSSMGMEALIRLMLKAPSLLPAILSATRYA